MDTHVHADHVTANWKLKEAFPSVQIGMSNTANVQFSDMSFEDGQEFQVGDIKFKCL
eukprot:CAMPEP_0116907028 /NCGR_PEP_ID=MMETSP0467-20121206/12862_1 /TAXON_ID=283647 /ORGANISM="Mesodinium pulex, Strain SPMC105" /LENGTH=56 /DNA_ID=CAMNT_0004581969 /DNA_START=191 /DNA_END=361 /DNA_ORIENTATION=-